MSSTILSCLRRPHHSWIHSDNCLPFSRMPETSNKNPQPPPESWFSGNLNPHLLNLSKVSDLSSPLPSEAHPSLSFHDTTFSYFPPSFLASPCLPASSSCLSLQQQWIPQLYASPSVTIYILEEFTPSVDSTTILTLTLPRSMALAQNPL